jgi:hypothetical protein
MRLRVLVAVVVLGSLVTERASAEDPQTKPTVHVRAAGEVGMLWLARRYVGTLKDPARSLGGVVGSNATRLGPRGNAACDGGHRTGASSHRSRVPANVWPHAAAPGAAR